jgi:hypothetical protein
MVKFSLKTIITGIAYLVLGAGVWSFATQGLIGALLTMGFGFVLSPTIWIALTVGLAGALIFVYGLYTALWMGILAPLAKHAGVRRYKRGK